MFESCIRSSNKSIKYQQICCDHFVLWVCSVKYFNHQYFCTCIAKYNNNNNFNMPLSMLQWLNFPAHIS